MATIIQKPDTLSLSRNLKELIISTSSEISLQLLKGDSMLLEETYLPDVNNRVHVNLADIVTSSLSLTMPSGDAVSTFQSSVYSDFTVKVDGTSVAEFTAVRSGVERFSDTAANFLTANWLTWQPQVKEVLHDQPEWLTYYPASGSCACYARFYYTDGTSGEIKVCDVSQCVSINTRFSKLWALDESGKERYGVIDVYIKDAQGLRLTYVQRYVLCSQGALDEVYLCENSLGGLDTFRFYGDRKLVPEIGYTSLLLDNSYTAADPDLSRKWSQNTGMLTGRECEWCWELFRSSAAYHLYRGTILPIVLDASSVEKSAMSVLAAYSFDYRYASDLGLLNVVRSENLPEVVEISGPDAEVFFLTPRLNEFPSAVLSDDLIIPVQSPYEESWYTLSVGGLKSALLSSVETIYGPMWHEHDNLQVLNGLSVDSSGNLLYNGVQVGSGIVGAHDHHGETIRPEKIIVGDVEITCVDGRLHISKGLVSDGDIAAFGAEEGEEGGSGGLDIARLWEELAAEDTSKVIDVSHIPGSVVLQDELIEVLDDYPLTTEMNEALSGKADKDWVEKELAKYLLLTGGKISGDLEVTGTLKIGEAVLSYQDGRLRISKGVVSDGDLAAFGAEEGEEGGSGGLDIARLWEELEAKDSTKVIDESHMPDSVVLQGELTGSLEDYVMTVDMNTALAGKADLQHSHAIADVTGLQSVLNSKWEWDAAKVADVKVNNAVAADRLASTVNINGTPFNGESDIVTARWGTARTIAVWDFYNVNQQAALGIDGSANISLKLPQSIKVKTLSIDGVTLSVVGGRLHVDSTLTADGDLVTYGDGDGSSGGGLDEAAMWTALGTPDSSKVIDLSHIPAIPTSKITGLDSYVKKAGDTMTGKLTVDGTSSGNALDLESENATETYLRVYMGASYKAAIGYHTTHGAYLYNRFTATYLGLRDNGLAYRDGYVMWDAGNDGSGSGLDADLLDGYHRSTLFQGTADWLSATSGLTKTITVGGSSNTYYPVVIVSDNSKTLPTHISIWKNLGSTTPDISGNHDNGTSSLWLLYEGRYTGWDGNGGFYRLRYKSQPYGTLVAHASYSTRNNGGLIVWLRGGGCDYNITCTNTFTATVYLSSTNIGSSTYPDNVSPITAVDNGGIISGIFYGNATSATKLQTSRTLWGRPFNGEGNVSGAISSTGNITPSAAGSYNIGTAALWYGHIYGRYIDTASGYNLRLCTGGVEHLSIQASSGNVGIGTTSPAYKLDVAGTLRATDIVASSRLYIPSTQGNNVFDAYIA